MRASRVLVLVVVAAAVAFAQDGGALKLGVGAQKVLTVPGMVRIAVGDSKIADVKTIGNNQLLVIGVAAGKTSMIVWKGSGQKVTWVLTVTKQDL